MIEIKQVRSDSDLSHKELKTLTILHEYNFFMCGSKTTPYIHFHANSGQLVIHGKSMPEDPRAIYDGLILKLEKFISQNNSMLSISLKMEYFNTSSSKCIWEVLRTLKKSHRPDNPLSVDWHYEKDDDDMLEAGKDYSELLNLDFNYIPY